MQADNHVSIVDLVSVIGLSRVDATPKTMADTDNTYWTQLAVRRPRCISSCHSTSMRDLLVLATCFLERPNISAAMVVTNLLVTKCLWENV